MSLYFSISFAVKVYRIIDEARQKAVKKMKTRKRSSSPDSSIAPSLSPSMTLSLGASQELSPHRASSSSIVSGSGSVSVSAFPPVGRRKEKEREREKDPSSPESKTSVKLLSTGTGTGTGTKRGQSGSQAYDPYNTQASTTTNRASADSLQAAVEVGTGPIRLPCCHRPYFSSIHHSTRSSSFELLFPH